MSMYLDHAGASKDWIVRHHFADWFSSHVSGGQLPCELVLFDLSKYIRE